MFGSERHKFTEKIVFPKLLLFATTNLTYANIWVWLRISGFCFSIAKVTKKNLIHVMGGNIQNSVFQSNMTL